MLRNAALGSIGLGLMGGTVSAADGETLLDQLIAGPAPVNKTMAGVPFEKRETVRIAIVGTGLRGTSVLSEFLHLPNVRVTALCDVVQSKVDRARAMVEKAAHV